MIYTNSDFTVLALTLYREARGEGEQGMLAVGCVIRNRAIAYNKSIFEICTAKNQFTSMTVHDDPETTLWPSVSDVAWKSAQDIASKILNIGTQDITGGALYYANVATTTSGWFVDNIMRNPTEHPSTGIIGHHTFYK
jgi:spore germination cell wall hydrolase CwlJ-like protein